MFQIFCYFFVHIVYGVKLVYKMSKGLIGRETNDMLVRKKTNVLLYIIVFDMYNAYIVLVFDLQCTAGKENFS